MISPRLPTRQSPCATHRRRRSDGSRSRFRTGSASGTRPSERWTVAADYGAQPWAGADFNGSSPFGSGTAIASGSVRSGRIDRADCTLIRQVRLPSRVHLFGHLLRAERTADQRMGYHRGRRAPAYRRVTRQYGGHLRRARNNGRRVWSRTRSSGSRFRCISATSSPGSSRPKRSES
jgi:hypothetical protein